MKRSGRGISLAALVMVAAVAAARPGMAQRDESAAMESTAAAGEKARLAYGGAAWEIDPDKGPVQAVVTKRTVEANGTTIEGIVFVEDAGGWRVAGGFRDDSPSPALLAIGVDGELTLAAAGN
jgi:hypothetical protein